MDGGRHLACDDGVVYERPVVVDSIEAPAHRRPIDGTLPDPRLGAVTHMHCLEVDPCLHDRPIVPQ